MNATIMSQVETEIKAHGFDHFGWAPLSPAPTLPRYEAWLGQGFHADMEYLVEHLPAKQNPTETFPGAQTALVVAAPYFPALPGREHFPWPANRVSLYAQGDDYHFWFRRQLTALGQKLEEYFPGERIWCATDSAPILERDLAQRAGLGWIGKNTCLIDRQKGSLFFVGEILTTAQLSTALKVSPDFCGNCRRCIEACPTQALNDNRELDARKCISYWTIESKEDPPKELRAQLGGWLFGCDICQTVCPWNEKVFGPQLEQRTAPSPRLQVESELREILNTSNKQLEKKMAQTPLSRAGGRKLKRNAILAAVTYSLHSLLPEISLYLDHPRLGPIAQWAVSQLTDSELL